jgi:hypothetical protein
MHPDFKRCTLQKNAIFNVLRGHFNVLRNFIISTLDVLRNTSNFQSAAEILQSTQQRGGGRSTAALLPLKNLYLCMYAYMHMYIGVSMERRLKCCATRLSGVGALTVSRLAMAGYFPSMAGAR